MFLDSLVSRASSCIRQVAGGVRSQTVRFCRLFANRKVTLERLIGGWSTLTRTAVTGRHVLAIQDTTQVHFKTEPGRRRKLGVIGRGNARGVMAHVMIAVDASQGNLLGPVCGKIWTRRGLVRKPHELRGISQKESGRWQETAQSAKLILAAASMVTVIADRESDIFNEWASVPEKNFHLLTRANHDRSMPCGNKLSDAVNAMADQGLRTINLPARAPNAPERDVELRLRYGTVQLRRPHHTADAKGMPDRVTLTVVDVLERNPRKGQKPVHWQLLTSHTVGTPEQAWQIVDWYRQRWVIEQLFRLMKSQGLDLGSSQLADAERLMKLTALVVHAATITLQLVQSRSGKSKEPADIAFTAQEIEALSEIEKPYNARTALQSNPHKHKSLAWATWIISRLGGWDGYPSSAPPGPITMRNGLERFKQITAGFTLKDVCIG